MTWAEKLVRINGESYLQLSDVPLVDVGIVVCSLSGNGIGDRVRISRLTAYETALRFNVQGERITFKQKLEEAFPPR